MKAKSKALFCSIVLLASLAACTNGDFVTPEPPANMTLLTGTLTSADGRSAFSLQITYDSIVDQTGYGSFREITTGPVQITFFGRSQRARAIVSALQSESMVMTLSRRPDGTNYVLGRVNKRNAEGQPFEIIFDGRYSGPLDANGSLVFDDVRQAEGGGRISGTVDGVRDAGRLEDVRVNVRGTKQLLP